MTRLPPLRITQGEPFAFDMAVGGMDWTGYTGAATFKLKPAATETILSVAVSAEDSGLVQFDLTAEETATLPALPRLGFMRTCICEVALSNGVDSYKYQSTVSVAAEL